MYYIKSVNIGCCVFLKTYSLIYYIYFITTKPILIISFSINPLYLPMECQSDGNNIRQINGNICGCSSSDTVNICVHFS